MYKDTILALLAIWVAFVWSWWEIYGYSIQLPLIIISLSFVVFLSARLLWSTILWLVWFEILSVSYRSIGQENSTSEIDKSKHVYDLIKSWKWKITVSNSIMWSDPSVSKIKILRIYYWIAWKKFFIQVREYYKINFLHTILSLWFNNPIIIDDLWNRKNVYREIYLDERLRWFIKINVDDHKA